MAGITTLLRCYLHDARADYASPGHFTELNNFSFVDFHASKPGFVNGLKKLPTIMLKSSLFFHKVE